MRYFSVPQVRYLSYIYHLSTCNRSGIIIFVYYNLPRIRKANVINWFVSIVCCLVFDKLTIQDRLDQYIKYFHVYLGLILSFSGFTSVPFWINFCILGSFHSIFSFNSALCSFTRACSSIKFSVSFRTGLKTKPFCTAHLQSFLISVELKQLLAKKLWTNGNKLQFHISTILLK